MKKSLLLVVSLTFCTLITAVPAKAGKPVTCGSDDYTLLVDFYATTTSVTYNILSDGGGTYKTTSSRNNKANVGFQVANCTYDLLIDLVQSTRRIDINLPSGMTTSNFVNFDRIASVPITDGSSAFQTWCQGPQQKTDGSFYAYTETADNKTIPYDSYAGCGSDTGGYYARRCVGFGLANNYNLRFQTSPFGGNTPLAADTNYIKVYHPSPNTWNIEPEAPATSVYYTGTVADSYPQMPFRIAVTKP
jgi:hypothetical protein